MSEHVGAAALAVALVQVVTGIALAAARRGAVAPAGRFRLDAVDLAAVALAAFACWAASEGRTDSDESRTAVVAVLLGTGFKEALRAWSPNGAAPGPDRRNG